MNEAPSHVTDLAEQWAEARAERDHATADALRGEIEAEGWLVHDTADGFELTPRPPFEVWPTVGSVPETGGAGERAGTTPAARRTTTDPSETADRTTATDRDSETTDRSEETDRSKVADRDTSADPGQVAEAADPGRRPEQLGKVEADRVAETQAAPAQKPEGSELVGRSDEPVGHPERMVSSQLLWDASLSVSRLDESITPPVGAAEAEVAPPTVTVGLVVDGWPDDLRECVRALVARTEAKILALDLGDVDGAGTVLNELVKEFPRRVEAWHVAETPHWRGGTAGWGESRTKLLDSIRRTCTS